MKIITDKRRHFDAELAADRFLASHALPRIPIRDSGISADGIFWIAYDWVDLRPLEPTRTQLEDLAAVLGRLHRLGMGWRDTSLRTFASAPELAWSSIVRVHSIDQRLARRMERLFEVATRRWPSTYSSSTCLLHGDFGFRNVGRTDAGNLLLLDYEHASIGMPILEFAKAWDRELAKRRVRADFLATYSEAANISVDHWDEAGLLIRLWGAAGIFPYAIQHDDRAFARHGRGVIERLERETGLG